MADIPRKLIVPKNVTDALRLVKYPESEEDIVSMDMVQEIRIAGKKVSFSLVFQRSDDKNIETVKKACVAAIENSLGTEVEIRGKYYSKSHPPNGASNSSSSEKHHRCGFGERWRWKINCCCKFKL